MSDSLKRLKIPRPTFSALEDLASKRGTTVDRVLIDAVNTEVYLDDKLDKGYLIVAQDPETEESWKIIFSHMR